MKTVEYNVYEFKELSKEAKQRAIDNWYEKQEDYPMLSENLDYMLDELLAKYKIKETGNTETKLYYSLGYCQGDGTCFIGSFLWGKYNVRIEHSGRYYHSNSVSISLIYGDELEKEADEKTEAKFKVIYDKICKEIEKAGYAEIEYRMDFNEFEEHCEANEYNFLEDGTMENA